MADFLKNNYLLFKSLHIIFFTCWMAGLFYLPRLFYYHVSNFSNPTFCSVFSTMERRLLKIIMNPSIILTYTFGIFLFCTPGVAASSNPFFYIKFICVLFLSLFHFFCIQWYRSLSKNYSPFAAKTYKFLNEIPSVLFIIIVFIAIFKRF
ncbi:MAG: CopD family protein [Proteobacteria bacterium]|nr:CopD family protein [Pseudomonadota bacterium]